VRTPGVSTDDDGDQFRRSFAGACRVDATEPGRPFEDKLRARFPGAVASAGRWMQGQKSNRPG